MPVIGGLNEGLFDFVFLLTAATIVGAVCSAYLVFGYEVGVSGEFRSDPKVPTIFVLAFVFLVLPTISVGFAVILLPVLLVIGTLVWIVLRKAPEPIRVQAAIAVGGLVACSPVGQVIYSYMGVVFDGLTLRIAIGTVVAVFVAPRLGRLDERLRTHHVS